MDVAYINPFISATSRLFETMIRVPLKLGRPSLRRPEDRPFKLYRFSAVLDLSGPVAGRIVLSFSHPVAAALTSALAGKDLSKLDDELLDALGEIANMIVGGAKPTLPDAGQLRISPPQVLPTAQVAFPPHLPVITIPFDTATGRFIIETALQVGPPAQQPLPKAA